MMLWEPCEYWPTRDGREQPIPLNEAFGMFDRKRHLTRLGELLHQERDAGKRRFVAVVPARSSELPRALPLRIERHLSITNPGARMLGCGDWTEDQSLDAFLSLLHDRLLPATSQTQRKTSRSAAPGGSARQRFKVALGTTNSSVLFCQFLDHTRYAGRSERAMLKSSITDWLRYFADECPGPARGTLAAIVILTMPNIPINAPIDTATNAESSNTEDAIIDIDRPGYINEIIALFTESSKTYNVHILQDLAPVAAFEYDDWMNTMGTTPSWQKVARDFRKLRESIYGNNDALPLQEIHTALSKADLPSFSSSGAEFQYARR